MSPLALNCGALMGFQQGLEMKWSLFTVARMAVWENQILDLLGISPIVSLFCLLKLRPSARLFLASGHSDQWYNHDIMECLSSLSAFIRQTLWCFTLIWITLGDTFLINFSSEKNLTLSLLRCNGDK